MTTTALRGNTYKAAQTATKKRESLITRYLNAYKEYMPGIICGILAMNGSNVYPVYKALTK